MAAVEDSPFSSDLAAGMMICEFVTLNSFNKSFTLRDFGASPAVVPCKSQGRLGGGGFGFGDGPCTMCLPPP